MADVLVLNRDLFPVNVVHFRRAIVLLYLGHADVIDEDFNKYDFNDWKELSEMIKNHPSGFVFTPSFKIAIPDVIALRFFNKVIPTKVKFTRRNIYELYKYRCCYCGKKFPPSQLNLDHIIPKSQGGKTEWRNVVTSCIGCNLKKGSRTPHQANMSLLINPQTPKSKTSLTLIIKPGIKLKSSWQRFVDNLYWNTELEE